MTAYSLERVLARTGGGVTARHVRLMCQQGKAQRWVTDDGSVVVTQLLSEPDGDVCSVWLAEGSLSPLLELHEKIVAWARAEGCVRMRITGRDGWLRVVPGYAKTATVMERAI